MTTFKWGVFGTGSISAKFVAGLRTAENAEVALVASRTEGKAASFAAATGIPRAVGGYAKAAAEGGIDAIYIATPASEHAAHARLCVEAGIPALVEKPFASTSAEAQEVWDAASARGVFAMEAMWTRFLPAALTARDRVLGGEFGTPRVVTGSFGVSHVPEPAANMFNPALAGGALSHLAPYPLSLAQWLFGTPTSVQAVGIIGSTGVDETVAIQTRYVGDVLGSFYVSLRAWAPDHFHVLGSNGSLRFRGSIVRPHGLELSYDDPRGVETANFGLKARVRQHPMVHAVAQRAGRSSRSGSRAQAARYAGNGYHYEADEVRAQVLAGRVESPSMTKNDTMAVLNTLDTVRSIISAPTNSDEALQ